MGDLLPVPVSSKDRWRWKERRDCNGMLYHTVRCLSCVWTHDQCKRAFPARRKIVQCIFGSATLCLSLHMCVLALLCVCPMSYIYIYIYIHAHTHTHTHIPNVGGLTHKIQV